MSESIPLKRCYVCKEYKEPSEFYRRKVNKDGLRYDCKLCCDIASKAYAKKNWAEKIQPKARGYRVKCKYGITPAEYARLHDSQNGLCAICTTPLLENGNGFTGVSVDHCHTTGKVRGLLCGMCNAGIGKLKDSVPILAAAIIYLRKYGTDLETSS